MQLVVENGFPAHETLNEGIQWELVTQINTDMPSASALSRKVFEVKFDPWSTSKIAEGPK